VGKYAEIVLKDFCPICNGKCRENCVFRQGEACGISYDLGKLDAVYQGIESLTAILQKMQEKKRSKEMRQLIETLEQYDFAFDSDEIPE